MSMQVPRVRLFEDASLTFQLKCYIDRRVRDLHIARHMIGSKRLPAAVTPTGAALSREVSTRGVADKTAFKMK